MKKLISIALLLMSFGAQAQYHYHHRHYHHRPPHNGSVHWIVPAIIGGAVVYGLTSRPAAAQPPTVIYVPQGYPPPPAGFRYEQINDANCNCLRWVLVQNNPQ